MATLRKAVLATAMISTGLLSTSGLALAGTSSDDGGLTQSTHSRDGGDHDGGHGDKGHDKGGHDKGHDKGQDKGHGKHHHGHGQDTSSKEDKDVYQNGLINSNGFKPNINPDLCNNDVPVNVLGVQVPLQDITGALGLLSKTPEGNNPSISKGCANPAAS